MPDDDEGELEPGEIDGTGQHEWGPHSDEEKVAHQNRSAMRRVAPVKSRRPASRRARAGEHRGIFAEYHRLCGRYPVDDELCAAGLQGLARGHAVDLATHVSHHGDELQL